MADETLRLIIEALDKNAASTIKAVKDELGGVKDKTTESSGGIGDFVDSLISIPTPAVVATAALAALGTAWQWSLDQAAEAELAQAKLEAVLQATGGAAGMSANQLNDLANEVSRLSGLDDELVLNAEAVLLTFRNINQEAFPQAIKLAADMSAVLGQDLNSSVIMVGKALNDPIQGMTAMQRVGVSFSQSQKDAARAAQEAGNMMAAQAVILDELKVEFGGAAEAMGNTYTGSTEKLKVAFGNLGAAISDGALGPLAEFNVTLAEYVNIASAAIESNTESMQISSDASEHAADVYQRQLEILKEQGLAYSSTTAAVMAQNEGLTGLTVATEAQRQAAYDLAAGELNAAQVADNMTNSYTLMAQQIAEKSEAAADGIGEIEIAYDKVLNLAMRLQTENDKFAERTENLTQKQADLKKEIEDLIAQGWSPYGEKVAGLQEKYDEIGSQINEVANEHSQAVNRMIYDLQVQKLSADGVTDAEYQMIVRLGESMGIMDSKTAAQALAFDQLTSAVRDGKLAADDLKRAVDMLPSGKTIDVILKILRSGSDFAQQTGSQRSYGNGSSGPSESDMRDAGGEGLAGGMYVITPTAAPEGFIPNTSGTFIPNLDRLGTGGGSVVMNITIATPINLASEDEALRALAPLVEQITDRRR